MRKHESVVELETSAGSLSMMDSVRLMLRVLTYRATKDELRNVNYRDLIVGLLVTWIVGIGRYWDNSRVELLQQMGVGSVVYVFVLALFLFCFMWPLRPKNLTYFRLLVFITMTSLPALLYAIPVQMIFPEPGLDTANEINLAFLAVVSLWRLSLLIWYMKRLGEMRAWKAEIGAFFPIILLIAALVFLNLEKVVFNMMGGLTQDTVSPNDDGYIFLTGIIFFALFFAIPVLIGYIVIVCSAWQRILPAAPKDEEAPCEEATDEEATDQATESL